MHLQSLPFPAVTMNAAKMDHLYRMIEAGYNHINFDCSDLPLDGENRTCQACIDATKLIREELRPTLENMLFQAMREYRHDCSRFQSMAQIKREASEDVRKYLVKKVCSEDWGRSIVRSLSPCLSSSRTFYRKRSDMLEIMSKRMRISQCLNEVASEFQALCGSQSSTDQTCEELVTGISDSMLCTAFGAILTNFFHMKGPFSPGVVLKFLYEQENTYLPTNYTVALLNSLFNRNETDNYPQQCLQGAIFLYGTGHSVRTECEEENFGIDFWLGHMDLVYKLMKQTIAPNSKIANERRELGDRNAIRKAMQREFNYHMNDEPIVNDYATLLTCKYGDMNFTDNCKLFSNMFTTSGFGYTFNNPPFWSLFRNTTSNLAFYKEMYEKNEIFETQLPRHISRIGPESSLDFVVRHDSYDKCDCLSSVKHSQEAVLALHDPEKLPILHSEAIIIHPGYFYDIRVVPSVTITDESALEFDPETRNCLSKHENEALNVFKTYSQSACLFECKIEKAIKACNCSSLEYPRTNTSVNPCIDFDVNNECFHHVMANDSVSRDCNCLNDCEYIKYDMDLHVTKLRQTNYEEVFE